MKSWPSPFEIIEQNWRMLDLATGRNSVLRMLASQDRVSDLIAGHYSAANVVNNNSRALEIARGQNSTLLTIAQSRRVADLAAGRNSLFQTVEGSRKLLESIAARRDFAATIGINDTLAAISSRPYFSTMIATAVMPRPAWIERIETLRTAIGEPLYAQAVAGFDQAADLLEAPAPRLWWIERLPVHAQLGLLLIVLQVIEKVSEFAQDATGVHLPKAYTSGVEVLFALAAAILFVIDARVNAVTQEQEECDR